MRVSLLTCYDIPPDIQYIQSNVEWNGKNVMMTFDAFVCKLKQVVRQNCTVHSMVISLGRSQMTCWNSI